MSPNPHHHQPPLQILADQCVMCGLCLPRCPTYLVNALEGRSPRGRIAHMRRLANGAEPTPALVADLDSCLACGRCESACPSHVRYGAMLPAARSILRSRVGEPTWRRALRALAKRPALLRRLLQLTRRLPPWALVWLRHARVRALLGAAKAIAPAAMTGAPTARRHSTPRDRVLLFRGCVGTAIEADTHSAAVKLLEQAGYEVVIDSATTCCGSLAQQAGAWHETQRDANKLLQRVQANSVVAVVACASGCITALRNALRGPGLPAVYELLEFLERSSARESGSTDLRRSGDPRRIALAVPCTQLALDGGAAARHALGRVADVEVVELPDAPGCCGAGATQFLIDPETARRLRMQRARQIAASGACMVATTNTGCRLHLQMGLSEIGLDLPVVHPATIMITPTR